MKGVRVFLGLGTLLAASSAAVSANVPGAGPAGGGHETGPVVEGSTLHSIGLYWVIGGEENQNADVRVMWREAGTEWKNGAPLFRVEKDAHRPKNGEGSVAVPPDATLYAGSLLLLTPGTEYEIKLSLNRPGASPRDAVRKARTMAEPVAPKDARIYHVTPGEGGGTGTEADPFRGMAAAQSSAKPGTIFLLRAGKYSPFQATKNGEPGRPIVWRSAEDGAAVIEGDGKDRLISADSRRDVWFEGFTLRRGNKGVAANGAARLVIRRCKMSEVEYGVFGTGNAGDTVRGWFVADNVIEGPCTWPRSKGIEAPRGIQVTGEGHVVCYNRVRGFADAINTFPSVRCANIDFHHNEVSELTDDGIELDFSERNVRCFYNRLTSVYQGVSTQPAYGGPIYIFRNALYNVVAAPFKLHNNPSGVLLYHNTVVKKGMPFFITSGAPVRHSRTRNNLFLGTDAPFAFESTSKTLNCDFDYDGVGGGPWNLFLKWNGVRYASLAEVQKKSPIWRHATPVEAKSAFASGAAAPPDENKTYSAPDLRLNASSAAVDAGEPIAGMNDRFAGKAPDLGAYELGAPPPHYGPRANPPR